MNGQSLVDLTRSHGTQEVYARLTEGLELGYLERTGRRERSQESLDPSMFSLKECAVAFCGEQWYNAMGPGGGNPTIKRRGGLVPIQEGTGGGQAVDVTAFSNITGQIIYYQILEKWETAEFISDAFATDEQTDLDGEKMPWITPILSNGAKIHPGMPYPTFGIAEEWIQTVALDTYGAKIEVHKLSVFYDRTAQVLREAGDVGTVLRRNKEFRGIDTMLGAPASSDLFTGSPLFNWKGVLFSPYQTNGTFWTNDFVNLPFVDWTSVRRIEAAATKILEPDLSGAGVNIPIEIDLDSIMVMPFHQPDLERMLHATELRSLNLGYAPNQITIGGNIVKPYKPYVSKIAWRRSVDAMGLSAVTGSGVTSDASQSDELWFMWDSKRKPLVYKQNWPLIVVTAPPQNIEEFNRDIVFMAKASERGNYSWRDPRMAFRAKGTPT